MGALALWLLALAAGCEKPKPEALALDPTTPAATTNAARPVAAPSLSDRISRPAAPRVVAIGDLHGDLGSAKRALRLAGAIDDAGTWIGKDLTVVQLGDEIDRGDDDRKILDLFTTLAAEAKKAGAELIPLDGNHELMNAALDFRYVTSGGFAAFADVTPKDGDVAARVAQVDERARGRAAAFAPGGPYAKMLAERPIVVKVGDTIFVHGGVLPKHVAYGLDKMNDEVHAWLLGKDPSPPAVVVAEDGPVWTRLYSAAPGKEECAVLAEALGALGAKRMVVGHTVQRDGINAACDGKIWRADVGLSSFYHGPIQALEIKGDAVTVLREGS